MPVLPVLTVKSAALLNIDNLGSCSKYFLQSLFVQQPARNRGATTLVSELHHLSKFHLKKMDVAPGKHVSLGN